MNVKKHQISSSFILMITGIALALLCYFSNPFHQNETASKVIAIAILMIFCWVSEALPMPVVALMPIVLFPIFKISTIEQAALPYANPIIFLFMGGFMLGLAIEKWNLHRRIALNIIDLTGTSGNHILLGFIFATGILSMWLSNTATTMMMFPIALSVIHVVESHEKNEKKLKAFSLALMLAIAYSSNIGGIATIIGTPPNVAYVGYYFKHYNDEVDFIKWMMICMPLSILLLIGLYLMLVKVFYPNHITSNTATKSYIKDQIGALGKINTAEKRVLIIFVITALLWIFRTLINSMQSLVKLDDTIIAVLCAISLFAVSSGNKDEESNVSLLEWKDTSKMAWGILLLFGGGISLATALENAGLIEQLGQWLSQFSNNTFLLIAFITIVSIFISEVMSNVAQVIVFAPVVSAMADALQINPLLLGIPMTLSASLASMFPMGTPPNAIVFASGKIKFFEMVKIGFVMNLLAIILVILFTWFFVPLVFPGL